MGSAYSPDILKRASGAAAAYTADQTITSSSLPYTAVAATMWDPLLCTVGSVFWIRPCSEQTTRTTQRLPSTGSRKNIKHSPLGLGGLYENNNKCL